MKKLFNVTCEIIIDADNEEDAMQRVYAFLEGDITPEINFLVHNAEQDESFKTLKALRNHQAVEHTLAADLACTCRLTMGGVIAQYNTECPNPKHRQAAKA